MSTLPVRSQPQHDALVARVLPGMGNAIGTREWRPAIPFTGVTQRLSSDRSQPAASVAPLRINLPLQPPAAATPKLFTSFVSDLVIVLASLSLVHVIVMGLDHTVRPAAVWSHVIASDL